MDGEFSARLREIKECQDRNRKNLLVAELVSDCFRARGFDPIIVGGSAVEFYSDGRYVSGDVDICYSGPKLPRLRDREEVMSPLGTSLGLRKWRIDDVMVDVLGEVETTARSPFQEIGKLKLIQIEDLIAERILIATYPAPVEERLEIPRLLLRLVVKGAIAADMQEVERVAETNDYRVGEELRAMLHEVRVESEAAKNP